MHIQATDVTELLSLRAIIDLNIDWYVQMCNI